jgi:NAD(P)-dependent dehydrogenase (short-subunit alcohol dehydrogenase family)
MVNNKFGKMTGTVNLAFLNRNFSVENTNSRKKILITGGTSGLGKHLTEIFLADGYDVMITGLVNKFENHDRLKFFHCDFSDLNSVVKCASQIGELTSSLELVINNAGILSPAGFTETSDGFEKTYQVNFLAHFLLTSLLQRNNLLKKAKVINVSSPMYRKGSLYHIGGAIRKNYGIIQAYSDSKLFLVLFSARLAKEGVESFTFNPGTFSSGIYRSQDRWFHIMYRIAAPFMVSAQTVAGSLVNIINHRKVESGEIINRKLKMVKLNAMDEGHIHQFWLEAERQISKYL